MTPQELHLSILERAFQGRLTNRMKEEGTGAELLDVIKAEKLRLAKAKIIKKEKELPVITEDDAHFDIPETWTWAYVGDIFLHNTGKAQNSSGSENGIVRKFITTSNLYWNRFDFSKVKEMPFTEKELERCTVKKGDLLVCEGGDCGRSAIWCYDEEVCIQNHVHRLRPFVEISIEYFYHLFYLYKFTGKLRGRGVGVQGLSNEAIHQVICPLPPIAEQKRIVAKIEKLLPYIDRYEQAWSKLEDFNKRFPVEMQKSILQMAIQGKLVEQRPEEGTGEELFQQIQAQKQYLIKAGKLKKEKPLPEITEDEIPFDIPDTWRWVQLGDLCSVVTGRLDANAQKPDGNYAFFTCGREVFKTDTYAFDCDAILLGGNNASGDYKMHRYAGKFNAYQRVYVISGATKDTLDFLYHVVTYWLGHLKRNSQGTTTRFIKLGQVTGMLIPFPPLEEQKRIVAKLEEILPLCERLK